MSLFTTYLETEIKKRAKTIPTPKGFKQRYTGGNIYCYEGKLPNGKYVTLFGWDDLGENEKLTEAVHDANTAMLYKTKDDYESDNFIAHKDFKNAEQLKAILEKWSK